MAADWVFRKTQEAVYWAQKATEFDWKDHTAYCIGCITWFVFHDCQLRLDVAARPRMSATAEANQRLLNGESQSSFNSMSTASTSAVDTSGDAELARRLQMEEQGAGNQVRRTERKRRSDFAHVCFFLLYSRPQTGLNNLVLALQ